MVFITSIILSKTSFLSLTAFLCLTSDKLNTKNINICCSKVFLSMLVLGNKLAYMAKIFKSC